MRGAIALLLLPWLLLTGDAYAQPSPEAPPETPPTPAERPSEPPAQSPPDAPPPPSESPEPAPAPAEPAPITRLPELTQAAEADYPERARAEGIEAEVILQIDIDAAGHVDAVSVVTPASSAGYGFDAAAVAAAKRFVFSPAMAGEQPVPVRITYRYRFFLQPEAPPVAAAPGPAPAPSAVPAPAQPPARAPVVNFAGELVERGTRKPLAGLVVTVFRGPPSTPTEAFEAVTDSEGRFVFYDLALGPWHLLVEAEGYFPVRSTETVVAGQRTELRYYVERGSYNPFDVLVEVDRPRRELTRRSLQIEQIERIPGTAGDALAVVQNLPGVARPAPLSGEILVRGAAPEDTQVVIESMAIPLIYHFGGLRSVVPTPMLEGIDFYPGNFGPEYGRAIGGVVDVRLKRLSPERVHGIIDVSLLDANLFVEAPIGDRAAVAVAVRRSYVDAILEAAAGQFDEVNLVTAPRYYDAQVLAEYRPADGHSLRAFGLLSDDEFRLLFDNPGEADVRLNGDRLQLGINFYRGIFDYLYIPNERFENSLRLSVGRDRFAFELAQFEFDTDVTSVQVRDTVRVAMSDTLDLGAGIDHYFQYAKYRVYLPPPQREGETDPTGLDDAVSSELEGEGFHDFGAFLFSEWSPLPAWTLVPSLRFDYFARLEKIALAPRLTGRATVVEPWTLKAGVGLFYQAPPFDETDAVFGNPDLSPEGAVHYSAGVEYQPLRHLLVDVTGFYKTLFDLVAPSDEIVERGGELVEEQVANSGSGRVYGVEVMLRHHLNDNFMGWVAYTLMRSERRDRPGEPLRLFSRDQTHILTAVGTYRLPRNWEVSMRWRLVSGNPQTPVTGAVYNADRDAYEPVFGSLNARRIPAFHQLDLRVDKRWIWEDFQLALYLDIQNIYDRANPEGTSYSFDYSQQRPAQGLPILPILGLRAEY